VSDGRRDAVTLVMPEADLGRLGTDPGRPWRQLADVVVGQADQSGKILRISSDVARVLGARPKDLIGGSLRDLVHPEDVDGIGMYEGNDSRLPMRGRLRRPDGGWTEVGLLFSTVDLDDEKRICFAFIAHAAIDVEPDRVTELEGRLRRIADEVRAARLLDTVTVLPSSSETALGELSSRQWEILSRLLRGQRVDTIARELYVSPSTVRNHLSAIFRRFGVHSQRELLDLLRGR
jgi:DNA-binding CsgD family transcriptional regulator